MRLVSRIKVIHKQNAGVSAARNDGLAVASSDYISFIDSYDELETGMYEVLIGNAQRYGAEISHCGYKRVDEQGRLIKNVSGTDIILVQNCVEAIKCMLAGRFFVGGLWNKLFQANIVKSLQLDKNLKNTENILFNVLAFQKAERIVFQDVTKYVYYEHAKSACNTIGEQRQLCDAVRSSRMMLENSCNETLREVYQERLFEVLLRLYQFSLSNSECSLSSIDVRKELRIAKRQL